MSTARALQAFALAAAALCAAHCRADSSYVSPASSGSKASANLDFSIVVPAVLYLRIGPGSVIGAAANATVSSMTFAVPSAHVGDGTAITAGAADGDLGNGAVTVRLFSNVGTSVSLNSNITGQLNNGSGGALAWSRITVTPGALASTTPGFTNAAITPPAFAATSGNGTATTLAAAGGIVANECQWTFAYANQDVVQGGTYGSTAAGNGVVTYTAVQL